MYIHELTLREFINEFPNFPIPQYIDRRDNNYIVRFTADLRKFEFGYPEDHWKLKPQKGKRA